MTAKRLNNKEAQAVMDRLQELSLDDLHELFKQGRVPKFEEIEGECPGIALVANPKATWIKKGWELFYGNNPLARWSGMEFVEPFDSDNKGDGYNLFRNRMLKRRFKCETYIIFESIYDQNPCLRINYKFPSIHWNGFDDARLIEDGVLLAQGHMKKPVALFGFYWVTISTEKAT